MISEKQLAAWERLCNEATPGQWYTHEDEPSTVMAWEGDEHNAWEVATHVENPDAAFICAAREAVPALIAEVRKLQESLKQETNNLMDSLLETAKHKEVAAQLEKEADWLAKRLIGCPPKRRKENTCPLLACKDCWREAARRAVQND